MSRNLSAPTHVRQHGAAVLVLLLVIFIAATTIFLKQSNAVSVRSQADLVTGRAMAQAKEALIGRAATDINRPGSLPCPNINGDGIAPLFAGTQCPSYIGRLPWKTLDLPEPLDGNGDQLWYALSPGSRDHPSAEPINPQKPLELTLDGTPNIAAIIFSPGLPLTGQNGRPSNTVTDYLDGSNNNGDYSYVSGPASATFNDKALAITRDDIFRTVNKRVLGEIRGTGSTNSLRKYFADNGYFPWADGDGDGSGNTGITTGSVPYNDYGIDPALLAWLISNQWLPLLTYQRLTPSSAKIGIMGSVNSSMDVMP
jgi:hypothetical protein